MDDSLAAPRKGSVLIVDDDPAACRTLAALMEGEGHAVRCASNGHTALRLASEELPDVVLLDVRLPDVDGIEVCRRLKRDAGTRGVPVILLSALEDARDKVAGFPAGAVDYLVKPFQAEEVLARTHTHVALHRLQRNLGQLVDERTAAVQAAKAQLERHVEAVNRTEEELRERLQFETLLADLSARFVNLPIDQIDHEMGDALRRLSEFIKVDIAGFWQIVSKEPLEFALTHLFRPMGGPAIPEPFQPQIYFPWVLQKVLSLETVAVSRHTDLPPDAYRDRETWSQLGIKSTLVFPLSAGGGPLLGALNFDMMREECTWPEPLVARLRLVAQVFANALTRKRAEEELRESEARLSLATEGAGVGLWSMDVDTKRVWVTSRTREMFHFAPNADVTYDRFLDVIHAEDREPVRQIVRQALETGGSLLSEFRIVLPGGNIRWIVARGRTHFKPSGEPGRLVGVSADITERKQMEEQLQARLLEIERLKKELEQENIYLREEVRQRSGHEEVVGQSDAMRDVLALVDRAAPTNSTVLITGETGVGKEVIARTIHRLSKRKDRTLVTVNCASLPPSLIESELFGREKGAYTGAMTMMKGRFELSDGSTLFLDEIGELPIEVQAKLLRVLEEGRFERLGSPRTIHVDVRILAASNRDLARDVEAGKFRRDLYYRLNVFPIEIPPLRERTEDIPLLVWSFVRDFERKMGKRIESIPRRTMEALQRYAWPGNVRELRNVIEHAMIVSAGNKLDVRMPASAEKDSPVSQLLEDVERLHILSVLQKTKWRLTGEGGAAEQLGLKRTTLQSRMKKLGIKRPAS